MNIVCLDMEGVLVPEIWVALAEKTGLPELNLTTREEPDYDKLMNFRIKVLNDKGYGIKELQDVVSSIDPFPGAKEFLDKLRDKVQVVVLSDTFYQIAMPLMKKLGNPTLFCNDLEISPDGKVTGFRMRVESTKYTTVKGLHSIGFGTIAAGDSYNDIGMIDASKAGFLFRTTEKIKSERPDLPSYETYDELYDAIMEANDN